MLKKDSPIFFLDTHAGIGKYDLTSELAQKTREYETGVARIYNLCSDIPAIQTYQNIIHATNANSKTLRFYPGSPLIMRQLMRTQDHMILTELHQEDAKLLKRCFYHDKQVAVHLTNGYHGLKAFLPPKQRRGLILIDPPFEEKNEFEQIITGLQIALKRFPNGAYIIWYPIKAKDLIKIKNFYKKLKTILTTSKNIVNLELNSCGLVIINAPWQLELELKPVISWLGRTLAG